MIKLPRVPLQEAWRATSGVNWSDDAFDLRKAFLCAAFSELVYHHIHALEVGDRRRMWMVPCRAYQQIASGAVREDFMETLNRMEAFEAGEFFYTRNIVGVPIRSRQTGIIIVALRGTQDFYDGMIDLLCNPFNKPKRSSQPRYHAGFFIEAVRCFDNMQTRLNTWGAPNVPVYLTGHSLGGAIAGVIMAMLPQVPKINGRSLITAAYTFGMPRYGNKAVVTSLPIPYPLLRPRDPVPWLPPAAFGYQECPVEYDIAGNPLKRGTVDNAFSRMLFWNHYMEKYRKDLHKKFP